MYLKIMVRVSNHLVVSFEFHADSKTVAMLR